MKTYAIYQNLLAQVERVFRHYRQGSTHRQNRFSRNLPYAVLWPARPRDISA